MGCGSSSSLRVAELSSGEFSVQVQEERAQKAVFGSLATDGVFEVQTGSLVSIGVKNGGPTFCDVYFYLGDNKEPIGAQRLEPNAGPRWFNAPTWSAEPQRFRAVQGSSPWRVDFKPRRTSLDEFKAETMPFQANLNGWTPNNGQVTLGAYAGPPPDTLLKPLHDAEVDRRRARTLHFQINATNLNNK